MKLHNLMFVYAHGIVMQLPLKTDKFLTINFNVCMLN